MSNVKALPLNMKRPISALEGSRAFQYVFDFTTVPLIDVNLSVGDFGLSVIQTMFIDNSNSAAGVTFRILGTDEKIVVPAYSQAFFPILQIGPTLQIEAASAGTVRIPCHFINIEVAPLIWAVTAPGAPSGTVNVSGTVVATPAYGAFTNRSGVIAAGAVSQILCAANGARKRLFIQNPSDPAGQGIGAVESIYINFTAAAGLADGNSIEISPGGVFDTGQGPTTTEAITVIATTAGHRFIAREM